MFLLQIVGFFLSIMSICILLLCYSCHCCQHTFLTILKRSNIFSPFVENVPSVLNWKFIFFFLQQIECMVASEIMQRYKKLQFERGNVCNAIQCKVLGMVSLLSNPKNQNLVLHKIMSVNCVIVRKKKCIHSFCFCWRDAHCNVLGINQGKKITMYCVAV